MLHDKWFVQVYLEVGVDFIETKAGLSCPCRQCEQGNTETSERQRNAKQTDNVACNPYSLTNRYNNKQTPVLIAQHIKP